ncbi:hypothetical protein M2651_12745 [Clostridium sp. SYSU_GA19001]|uniref:hypothetical protein n=1 Tax=Clostridium caldaquaticum TaxID=2940653 RepID=UPI0020776410|nr:hypothetical protein [Clostridium caldaquaticum]MCM8711865.1 hypothetical protein [Clostridium caldaquaticum]
MAQLLDFLYYKLREKEIERARIQLKIIKIDTILKYLTKICWKSNIDYKIIIKTSDMLIIRFTGIKETVLFKYHKAEMVLKEEMNFFVSKLDENKAHKGVYITTGKFEQTISYSRQNLFIKRNIMFKDGYSIIKEHMCILGENSDIIEVNKFNFIKYLPQ